MPLNIDGLTPEQQPDAGNDIAVQWGDAVEADIRDLDTRVDDAQADATQALANAQLRLEFEAIGDLVPLIGYDMDQVYLISDFSISRITIICPDSPAAGTIEVDLFKITASGGSPVSLYSVNPLPTLTCNGGYAYVSYITPNLPDDPDLVAGSLLLVRITDAPPFARGLKVMVS